MHKQLSLYADLPKDDLRVALHALAALTGMKPRKLSELCTLWEPYLGSSSAAREHEFYRILAVLNEEDKSGRWSICINDIPEAGKRQVCMQSQLWSTIVEGDVSKFLQGLRYTQTTEFHIDGYELVYMKDLHIRLFCIQKEDGSYVDPDNWVVKAYVDVGGNATGMEATKRGTQLLEQLQRECEGLLDLKVPLRNALDMRVRREQG